MSTQPVRTSNRYRVMHTAATALHSKENVKELSCMQFVLHKSYPVDTVRISCGACLPSCKGHRAKPCTSSVVGSFLHLIVSAC